VDHPDHPDQGAGPMLTVMSASALGAICKSVAATTRITTTPISEPATRRSARVFSRAINFTFGSPAPMPADHAALPAPKSKRRAQF